MASATIPVTKKYSNCLRYLVLTIFDCVHQSYSFMLRICCDNWQDLVDKCAKLPPWIHESFFPSLSHIHITDNYRRPHTPMYCCVNVSSCAVHEAGGCNGHADALQKPWTECRLFAVSVRVYHQCIMHARVSVCLFLFFVLCFWF